MSVIRTENLSYCYSKGAPFETRGVSNINLSINKNQIIGVIGHTGSGKSTFAQLLNGLIKPTGGKIFLNDRDIWEDFSDIRQVHFKVGLTFQYPEHQLFGETVYKDIAFGPTNQGLSPDEVELRVLESSNFVKLSPGLLTRSPFELSGGEKRRVAIAGIIAMNPEVLILDEPTAGLDPTGKETLLNSICEYHKKTKNVVIFISHLMEDIAKISDRVIVMYKGQVSMYDTPKNVFSRGEELNKIGLGVPQITRIVDKIYKRLDINRKCIVTVDSAVDDIIKKIEKQGRS